MPSRLASNQTRSPMFTPGFGTMTTESTSLSGTGSNKSRPVMVATLVMWNPAVYSRTVTLKTIDVVAFTASVPMVHSPDATLYAPLAWLLYSTCAGSTSVRTTPVATVGPLFDATSVYAMGCRMSGAASVTNFATPTSAIATQLVTDASSSGCRGLEAVATLTSCETVPGASTVAWKVTVSVPPAVSVWPESKPGGAAAGLVAMAGRVLENSTLSRYPDSPLSQFSVPGVASIRTVVPVER